MIGNAQRSRSNAFVGGLIAFTILGAFVAPASGENPKTPRGPAGKEPVAHPVGKAPGADKPKSAFEEMNPLVFKKDTQPGPARGTPDRR